MESVTAGLTKHCF